MPNMPKTELFRWFSKERNAIALRSFDFFQAAVEEFAPAEFMRRRKNVDPVKWTNREIASPCTRSSAVPSDSGTMIGGSSKAR